MPPTEAGLQSAADLSARAASRSPETSRCIERALSALMQRRNKEGYWEGRLASSPLAAAVALCALSTENHDAKRREAAFEYLRGTQREDGGWGDTAISVSNLAATLLVLCADAMAAHASPKMLCDDSRARARAWSEKNGGLAHGLTRVYGKDLTFQVPIRMSAACAGLFPWNKVDALPFELALAPRSLMGVLRLPVVSYALPALVSVGLARHGKAPSWMLPLRWLREAIAERALSAILKMQPQSGGYLEAVPITAFCLLGLSAAGRRDHPVARNAARFLLETQRADGSWPVEVNLSVWNTTRAIDTLKIAGLLDTAMTPQEQAATRDWLLAQQCGGVSVYSDAQPGGWGWNHLSGSVPDADDTAGALIALRHLGMEKNHPALHRGSTWLGAIQNADGGWPTFCRGWNKLPFDRSAPDLTAHALRAYTAVEHADAAGSEAGVQYLKRVQRPDGSFAPLWFGCESAPDHANLLYGTAAVAVAACVPETIRKSAAEWIQRAQNADGGFGGCIGAPSSAEETGLALRALNANAALRDSARTQRAAEWLIANQRPDGNWNPAPIGFYFAVLWYYEEMYPLCYALGGL